MKYEVLDLNKIKLREGYGIEWLELEKWLFGKKYIDQIEVNGQTYIVAEVDDDPEVKLKL